MARGKERVELRGKHTVVTGAASGIGLELARVLLEKGAASISLLDIHEKNLAIAEDELRAKAQGTQTQIYALPVDITNESLVSFPGSIPRAAHRSGSLQQPQRAVSSCVNEGPGRSGKTCELCQLQPAAASALVGAQIGELSTALC